MTIPERVSKIGDFAFAHCEKVEHIVIQADKVELPYVKVERITLGKKIKKLKLEELDSLEEITVDSENQTYHDKFRCALLQFCGCDYIIR